MNFLLFFSFFLFNKINFSSYINRIVIIIRNHLQHLCFFHYFFSFSFAPPAHLFSLHIINMPNFFQVRLFLRIFLHLFFRPPKKRRAEGSSLHKIYKQHHVMYHLVSDISNFLVPLFRRIHYDMGTKQHEKLPVKPERQIERQTIQQTMHQQMIPVFTLRFGDEINLQHIVSHQMAHNQSEQCFANLLAWHFFCSFLFFIFQYAEKLQKRKLRIFLRIVFVKIQHIIYSLYI